MRYVINALMIFVLSGHSLYAAHIYFQQVKQINPPPQLIVFAKELRDSFNTNVYVFEEKDRFLISLDGYSHIYQVDSTYELSNLYKGRYHRYNIGAYKWHFENYIYAYGGNLLWNFFSEIIFFKEDVGGWEIQNYIGDKPIPIDSINYFSFFSSEKLNVFFLRPNLYLKYPRYYEYDFSDLRWKRRQRINEQLFPEKFNYVELKNFILIIAEDGKTKIISKSDLTIVDWIKVDPSANMISLVKGDNLIISNDLSQSFNEEVDISNEFTNKKKEALSILKFSIPWESLFIFLVIPLAIVFRKKNLGTNIFPFPKLLAHKGKLIDQEILDECIGVNYYSSISSKRNKRSKAVLMINQKYKSTVFIERIRDENDSRMFKYKIW